MILAELVILSAKRAPAPISNNPEINFLRIMLKIPTVIPQDDGLMD